ncbi:hypothetical protein BD310DRAFT_919405 [Dichomitus squalens]|uniref:Secreted protein n=1 Tax=Dichomitus squalens TaxID=114155 RepID=A0A4V6MWW5_9APHY|nr:hypothetical protein BD310DRAFT_919405 [Dichomitus squalens]
MFVPAVLILAVYLISARPPRHNTICHDPDIASTQVFEPCCPTALAFSHLLSPSDTYAFGSDTLSYYPQLLGLARLLQALSASSRWELELLYEHTIGLTFACVHRFASVINLLLHIRTCT